MFTASLWYLLVGFLLGNGMPHFAFGAAGKTFRSPFGRHSRPPVNVTWGIVNFVLATLLVTWRTAASGGGTTDLVLLLIGFWIAVVMFGTAMHQFLPATDGSDS